MHHFKTSCLACFLLLVVLHAQSQVTDSTAKLEDVVVKAYQQNASLKNTGAAINYTNKKTLQRFSDQSVVAALNSLPGIRMEERSPGSFRMNIRGSSLRSPFGVRNVKVYYNDIPITDPGGHTYLNQFGFYNFNAVEIIKGPASSLYGAGTGGAMIIDGADENENANLQADYTIGSYGLQHAHLALTTGQTNKNQFSFQHQQSAGYRAHSKLRRDVFSWNGNYKLNENNILKTSFLYGDLFYETPGALTISEYNLDHKASRPATGTFPSAEQAKASIHQQMFVAGASLHQKISKNFSNKTVLYGMFTDLKNPAIQNYGHNSEPHAGGRTVFSYDSKKATHRLNLQAGIEYQHGFTTVHIHKNVNGHADSLRTTDDINTQQSFVFTQATFENSEWIITGGMSLNFFHLNFQRFSPASLGQQKRNFSNDLAPRLSILKKIGKTNIYTSIAKGFSTPTTAELLPTGGDINLGLNAEHGINYDLGIRSTIIKNVFIDVNAFLFKLNNTIVQRRTAGGGDYYINSGSTRQHGIETALNYSLLKNKKRFEKTLVWLSYTWHDFHYNHFKQVAADYSGNQLPSIAPHTVSTGIDMNVTDKFNFVFYYYYAGKIPLNDANTAFSTAYHLMNFKTSLHSRLSKQTSATISVGVDNLLNQHYSLGNDINGFNGRYYNAAPARNYYVSLNILALTHHPEY